MLQSQSIEDIKICPKCWISGRVLNHDEAYSRPDLRGWRGINTFSLVERTDLEKRLSFWQLLVQTPILVCGNGWELWRPLMIWRDTQAGQQAVMASTSSLGRNGGRPICGYSRRISYNYFQRQVRGVLQNLDSVKNFVSFMLRKRILIMAMKNSGNLMTYFGD